MNALHPLTRHAEDFIERCREKRLAPLTIAAYETEIREFMRLAPDPSRVQSLKIYLGFKATNTYLKKLVVWQMLLKGAPAEWASMLEGFQVPKSPRLQRTFLTEEEAIKLRAVFENYPFEKRLVFELAMGMGLRIGEILSLSYSQFDLVRGELVVKRKGGNHQRLPLPPQVQSLLTQVSRSQGKIFSYSRASALRLVPEAAKEAGIERRITAHALRHTFATAVVSQGGSLAALKEFLGHSSLQTTEKYVHSTANHLRDALSIAAKGIYGNR